MSVSKPAKAVLRPNSRSLGLLPPGLLDCLVPFDYCRGLYGHKSHSEHLSARRTACQYFAAFVLETVQNQGYPFFCRSESQLGKKVSIVLRLPHRRSTGLVRSTLVLAEPRFKILGGPPYLHQTAVLTTNNRSNPATRTNFTNAALSSPDLLLPFAIDILRPLVIVQVYVACPGFCSARHRSWHRQK